jgi:hypothetical protein
MLLRKAGFSAWTLTWLAALAVLSRREREHFP